MSDPAGVCCSLELNPDITGIGVRASLYAQILLGWILSLVWPDTYDKNSRTAYMTATALLIASFIQLQTQELSLLDGLVVSLITSMMITFAIASNPAHNQKKQPKTSTPNSKPEGQTQSVDSQRSVTRSFMQFCFVVFWAAWSFNLWKDPAHFGLKDEKLACLTNYNVTLSVFGREINATDTRMQNAALALVSIGFFVALCSMWFSLDQIMKPVIWLTERGKKDQNTQDRKLYENPYVQGTHVVLQSVAIATLIYLTVSTEKTISKNDFEKTTRDWSYGQTIALILLLQQVMDVFSTWIEKREEREEAMSKLDRDSADIEMDAHTTIPATGPAASPATGPVAASDTAAAAASDTAAAAASDTAAATPQAPAFPKP